MAQVNWWMTAIALTAYAVMVISCVIVILRENGNLDSQNLSRADRTLVKLARNLSSSFYTVNNEIDIFTTGEDKFTALKADLLGATRSIYLQYYIFLDDTLGHEIAEILMRKAAEGVEVKVR